MAEAVGVVRAARAADVPVVVSFTVETDGRLPDGTPLGEAIEQTDADTAGAALHYMVNAPSPRTSPASCSRRRGSTACAGCARTPPAAATPSSTRPPTSTTGTPEELAQQYAALRARAPRLSVLGGCCGTDVRHVSAIAAACLPPA